jgi:hypothetical protein
MIRSPRRPRAVEIAGHGALAERAAASGPGWWHDGDFLHVPMPQVPASARVVWSS